MVTLGHGCFPDGFAFDEAGRIWVTSLISNRLLRVGDDRIETVLADENPEYVAAVDQAFMAGEMRTEHLGTIPGTRLQHLTSVAFGVGQKDVFLGSLHADCVYRLVVVSGSES